MRRLGLLLLACAASFAPAGCYLSFPRATDGADDGAAPTTPAGPSPREPDAGGVPVALPEPEPEPEPEPGCPAVEAVLDVPDGACASLTVPSTDGNACLLATASHVARVVRVRRAAPGPWSILIRSRGIDEGTIAFGFPRPGDCQACEFQGSASGGDLRAHGVGGSLPSQATTLDVALDGEGGGMWLRVCAAAR